MTMETIQNRDFSKEFSFAFSLSSGPGGQHVNKVNTRVELRFELMNSQLLTEQEKSILNQKLKSYITSSGDLILSSQTERSQIRNKEEAIRKFYFLVREALKPSRIRKPTKPTFASLAKRRKKKSMLFEKKILRKNPDL